MDDLKDLCGDLDGMAARLEEAHAAAATPAARREVVTMMAVVTGLQLIILRKCGDWPGPLRRIGISETTAWNYMRLAAFAGAAPVLFRNLVSLRMGELYRLARLGPAKAAELYPEAALQGPQEAC